MPGIVYICVVCVYFLNMFFLIFKVYNIILHILLCVYLLCELTIRYIMNKYINYYYATEAERRIMFTYIMYIPTTPHISLYKRNYN